MVTVNNTTLYILKFYKPITEKCCKASILQYKYMYMYNVIDCLITYF